MSKTARYTRRKLVLFGEVKLRKWAEIQRTSYRKTISSKIFNILYVGICWTFILPKQRRIHTVSWKMHVQQNVAEIAAVLWQPLLHETQCDDQYFPILVDRNQVRKDFNMRTNTNIPLKFKHIPNIRAKTTQPPSFLRMTVHFLRILQWWGKTAKGPIFLACSKRRNAGTPECRNTWMPEHRNAGTPECRNTGTPEYHFHFEGKL
jgi:hypothetical protein